MEQAIKPDDDRSKGIRVFVYGTLKRGYGNHPILDRGGATYLGDCEVGDNFTMLDLGMFPGVVRRTGGDGGKVTGEVYQVSEECLHSCDLLEGHPNFYRREKVTTPWKGAWIYLLPETYCKDGELDVIEGGTWGEGDV